MSDYYYFPRLQGDAARRMLADYSRMSIEELALRSALESDKAYWYPTAPSSHQVVGAVLRRFQASMREIAAKHGYPEVLSIRDPAKGRFDRDVVSCISELLPLLPAEAAQESVWSFLTLVVVPDVALWRWPNENERDSYERILGYPRNVFRRLWWRAFVLGAEVGSFAPRVLEDEAVAILERPSIGGNRPLARKIVEVHLSQFEHAPKRTDIMRDAMKRIRRLHGFISFHSLTEVELDAVVREAFDEASNFLVPD